MMFVVDPRCRNVSVCRYQEGMTVFMQDRAKEKCIELADLDSLRRLWLLDKSSGKLNTIQSQRDDAR